MSIGPDARRWFLSNFGETKNKIYTSKYYLPKESWPKKHVWWMKIPAHAIDAANYDHVIILCQAAPLQNEFHYLKVPVGFFHEHFDNFHKIGGEIDLYLSAEPQNLFREIRGTGNLDFSAFVIK
jgi:hypothetical protein